MNIPSFRSVLPWVVSALLLCVPGATGAPKQDSPAPIAQEHEKEEAVRIHYLEIVTADVEATCGSLAKLHDVTFGEPEAQLGNARTAALAGGGRIGVRAPMHEAEKPVVRPYVLVKDVAASVEAAKATGGELAVPPMEIPGQGKIAIYFLEGIEHGLWQL